MATNVTVVTRSFTRRRRSDPSTPDASTRPARRSCRRRSVRLRTRGRFALVSTAALAGAGALFSPAFADTARVAPGETLSAIAARYHTTVAALAAANHVADPNQILIGTVLQIPGTTPVVGAATGSGGSTTAGGVAGHAGTATTGVVRTRDTPSPIASHYHPKPRTHRTA